MTTRIRRQISIFASLAYLLPGGDAIADTAAVPVSNDLLPGYLLEVPDTVSDILIADTSTATMHRFVRTSAGITLEDERYMSIGQAGAGKQKAWDRKTPLGVYFITESLDTSKLHDKYGVAAFPLDYPNAWDRFNKRTGYGIWLHGVDHNNPERPPLDTDWRRRSRGLGSRRLKRANFRSNAVWSCGPALSSGVIAAPAAARWPL